MGESFCPSGPSPERDFFASCRMRAAVSGGASSRTSPAGTAISSCENISRPINVGSVGTSTGAAATAARVTAAMLSATPAFIVSTANWSMTPAAMSWAANLAIGSCASHNASSSRVR